MTWSRTSTSTRQASKWATDNLSLFATGFYTEVAPRAVNFVFGDESLLTTQESQGVELDAIWRTDGGFSVSVNATWLDTEITIPYSRPTESRSTETRRSGSPAGRCA